MSEINNNYNANTDKNLLKKMGAFIKYTRLKLNKSQVQLAKDAGINRSTLIELENGKSANMLTFIQVMRVLNQLAIFNYFEIENDFSPMQLAETQAKYRRKRASKNKNEPPQKSDW